MRSEANWSSAWHRHPLTQSTCGITAKLCTGSACWRHVRCTPELLGHYQMMDAYVQSLALERRYGPDRGPDTQKEREAAQSNLGRVIQDYRKRFSAFSPTAAMAYKKEINRVITTLLPAWLQFRNTFVPIKKAKEGNAS